MNKRIMQVIVLTISSALLMSCSYLSGPSSQHPGRSSMETESIPPVRLPPGVHTAPFTSYYPVPDHSSSKAAMDISLIPPGLNK